jgi:hypothetical protein
MLKKELTDVLKQTAYLLLAVLVLPASLLILKLTPRASFAAVFLPTFQIGLLFWALFLGASLFARERRQRAMEYVLTLPYSRLGLLGHLIVPRLIVLVFLYLLFWAAYGLWGASYAVMAAFGFSLIYISLFVVSLSLSPLLENFLALSLVALFASGAILWALFFLIWVAARARGIPAPWSILKGIGRSGGWSVGTLVPPLYVVASFALLLVPFITALVLSFRKFDARLSSSAKRYTKTLVPAFTVCSFLVFLLAIVSTSVRAREVYLTSDHKVVEFRPYGIEIRWQNKISKYALAVSSFTAVGDGNPFLYFWNFQELVQFDTTNGAVRPLFRYGKDGKDGRWLWRLWTYRGKVAFFSETGREGRLALVVFDENASPGKNIETIHCSHNPSQSEGTPILFGTGMGDGKRFWLIYFEQKEKHPFRLWEDGSIQDIFPEGRQDIRSLYYINDLILLFSNEAIEAYRDQGSRFELVRRAKENFSFYDAGLDTRILSQPRAREIHGKHGDKIARLDLETFEIEDIATLKTPVGAYVPAYFPERFYLVESDSKTRESRISSILNKSVRLLRALENFDPAWTGYRIDFRKEGIRLLRKNRIEFYAFPDLVRVRF